MKLISLRKPEGGSDLHLDAESIESCSDETDIYGYRKWTRIRTKSGEVLHVHDYAETVVQKIAKAIGKSEAES